VLQNLLRENVSILNLPLILECIADFASATKNPDDLSELVRRRLGLYFIPEYECRSGVIKAFTFDPRLEQLLATKIHRTPSDVGLSLDPATAHHLLNEINKRVGELVQQGSTPALVVSTEIRLPVKRFFESSVPRLMVFAFQELPAATEVENAGFIGMPAHLNRQEAKAA
jgi:flagellar biosynthesis protein FlhA